MYFQLLTSRTTVTKVDDGTSTKHTNKKKITPFTPTPGSKLLGGVFVKKGPKGNCINEEELQQLECAIEFFPTSLFPVSATIIVIVSPRLKLLFFPNTHTRMVYCVPYRIFKKVNEII